MSVDGTDITYHVPGLKDTVRLFVISDTHLYQSDSREEPFRQYSKRMAGAYNETRHFQTGEPTTPLEQLKVSLGIARDFGADAVFHIGDAISFPSELGVELVVSSLDETGIPWYYISGNHDWHYEGMEGTENDLRAEWSEKRLSPLYRGYDMLGYSVEVGGVKIILINDSTNAMLPEQLSFLRRELKGREPKLLFMHIPMYAPARHPGGYTIGNPLWGWDCDEDWNYEQRERWPKEGHAQTDYDFYDTALKAGSEGTLLGVVCGHVHRQGFDMLGELPQFTVRDNASGGYCRLTLIPAQ